MGGAPTDVLTKRLRDLERDGVVRRRELDPPATGVVYELTDLGRGLERPLVELGRWGLNFYDAEAVEGIPPASLPNSLRVILQPPVDASLTVQFHSEGHASWLRVANGWIDAERGETSDPDLTLSGLPGDVIGALVGATPDVEGVEIDGDPEVLEALRSMVVLGREGRRGGPLERGDDHSERSRQGEEVHQQRLERQHHRAGQHEQQQKRGQGDDADDEGEVVAQALLQIDEVRREAGNQERRRPVQGADPPHGGLRFVVERAVRVPHAEIRHRQVGGQPLEGGWGLDALDRRDAPR